MARWIALKQQGSSFHFDADRLISVKFIEKDGARVAAELVLEGPTTYRTNDAAEVDLLGTIAAPNIAGVF